MENKLSKKEEDVHIRSLKEFYGNQNKWIGQHKLVIDQSRIHHLAICGSLGRYIYTNNPTVPNDIDFVTDNLDDAFNYVSALQKYAMSTNFSYGKLLFQNKTEFCLEGVSHHFRLETSFWMPICIFVLKDPLKYWFKWNLKLQFMEDNKKYKKELDNKRNNISDVEPSNEQDEIIQGLDYVEEVTLNNEIKIEKPPFNLKDDFEEGLEFDDNEFDSGPSDIFSRHFNKEKDYFKNK